MNIINRFAHSIFRIIRNTWRINWISTIYFNLRVLPINQAIKLPIFLYGKVKFHGLSGKVIINDNITSGMIKIGFRWLDLFPTSYLPSQLVVRGKLTFSGHAIISGGVYMAVFNPNSRLFIGQNVTIGGGSMIKAIKLITIDDKTRITSNCTVFDSNMHFVKDINTGRIVNKDGNIAIGRNCWINSGCILTKGAVVPSYSIMARNSFVSKDMSAFGENIFIAGSPAKVIKSGVQRIFNTTTESKLADFFANNPTEKFYVSEPGIEIDN